MASDDTQPNGRQPIPPGKRKQLQQLFAHASKQAAQDNFDYATELFTTCVLGDLNNRAYWQSFLGNLFKKYKDNRKGVKLASLRTSGERASLKKAQLQKHWDKVIQHGVEILKLNPWDSSALQAMSAAGEELGLDEVPLVFLRSAMAAAPRDVELNRAAAKALRPRKQYDQAMACWQRVLEAKPGDIEAAHAMAELAVEKTITHGGYEDAESSRDVSTAKHAADEPDERRQADSSIHQLERAIQKNPSDMASYLELADVYFAKEDYAKAEETLARAYEASGHGDDMFEKLADARIRGIRKQLRDAEAVVRKDKNNEDAKAGWKVLRKQLNQKLLESAEHRCERFPNNLTYRYQLGEAYAANGQYGEAITHLQQARNDPRRKGLCLLLLGKCFERIKQHRLAMDSYDGAIEEISDQDLVNRKDVLYTAGSLALEMKDLDKAEQHLSILAGMDFGYKDVAALLDKIAKLRDNE
ncbi:MAG: tetratricopeptide repeat protein [Pirellulales bacterium]|nr:tetratricopeptide repeat protein [Pirellulales bacterium]